MWVRNQILKGLPFVIMYYGMALRGGGQRYSIFYFGLKSDNKKSKRNFEAKKIEISLLFVCVSL